MKTPEYQPHPGPSVPKWWEQALRMEQTKHEEETRAMKPEERNPTTIYRVKFYGRRVGAIGIMYWIEANIPVLDCFAADKPEEERVRLATYDAGYEDIHAVTYRRIS